MKKENKAVTIILSSREVVARDLPHPTPLLNKDKQPYFMQKAEDPRTLRAARCTPPTSGMTPNLQGVGPIFARPARTGAPLRSGFTLIELLVVVLIIGMLAAVAVPQYRRAVDKARLMKLVAMTKSVVDAEEAYYLANGTYTKDWDSLAVTLPGTVDSNAITFPDGQSVRLQLAVGGAVNGLTASDEKLSNVHIYAFYANNTLWPGVLACYAYSTDKRAVNLCKSFANNQLCTYGVKLCYYPYTDNG